MSARPDTKIALVTGATRGIGLETVRQLAEAGVHVLLAGRDRGRAEQAAESLRQQGLPVEAIALDVTAEDSITAAAAQVRDAHGRLDILVNNAGVLLDALDRAPSQQSLSVWRDTFDTNLFGVVAVTQAFLPLLQASPAPRIVNVSSILGSIALHGQPGSPIYDFKVPAYNVSKSALNAWTVHLAWELRDTPAKVNTVHPGYVKTDMNRSGDEQRGELDVEDGAKTSVRMALLPDDGPTGTFVYFEETLPW